MTVAYDPYPLHPNPPDTRSTPIHAHVIVWVTVPLMFVALVWASYDGGAALARHHAFDIGMGAGFHASAAAGDAK
jgi:uncharacterized protein (DUF2062 family)